MATNHFDEFQPVTPANPFDEFEPVVPGTRAVLQTAIGTNPDQAARAAQLAKQYQAPADVLARNLQDVELQAVVDKADERLKTSPKLAQALRDKPWLAQQAHDDIEPLAAVESLTAARADRTAMGTLGDVGVVALKGAVGLPQAFIGLGNLVSAGYVGKGAEAIGIRFEDAQAFLDGMFSPAQQQANEAVREAEGFFDTLGAMLSNPSTIAATVGESAPQMLGGAALGRGLLAAAPKLAPWLAAAFGEGIMGAGSSAEQIRQDNEDGLLSAKQVFAATMSGAGTALFGAVGGRTAQRLGLGDIDTALVARGLDDATAKTLRLGFATSIGKAGISEGVFEELPQSIQEQLWQNWATDRPLGEGVGKAAAQGLLAGLSMGGGFQAVSNSAATLDRVLTEREAARASAEGDAQRLAEAMATAAQSKLRDRNPETFQQLVDTMALGQDGAPAAVYIDANVLLQSATPEQLAQILPSTAEQLQEAAATNSAIEVPVAEALTYLPGTPLERVFLQNARSAPDALSLAEATQAGEQAQQFLQQEAERVMQQAADTQAWQASSETVKTTILDQLNTTGRFTPDVNEAYAALQTNFFSTMAARLGITPQEMYDRYSLKVQAGGQQGAVLDQFAGVNAATANTAYLAEAQQRVATGENAEEVRKATGWFQGEDGKWRFEFSDRDAKFTTWKPRGKLRDAYASAADNAGDVYLSEFLDHPNLYAAYPQIGEMRVRLLPESKMGRAAGSFTPKFGGVFVLRDNLDKKTALSFLIHEIQHGIQSEEGFAPGGKPIEGDLEAYLNLPGEREARATQARAGMTAAARRANAPAFNQSAINSEATSAQQQRVSATGYTQTAYNQAQAATQNVAPADPLIVAHNLSAENILAAQQIGGLAVPSLAITKAGSPLQGFGEVTLIGGQDMAAPSAKNPVFDADVYSPRFPSVKVKVDEAAVRKALEPLQKAAEAKGLRMRDAWYVVEDMQRNKLSTAISSLSYDTGARMGYAVAVLDKDLSVPTKEDQTTATKGGLMSDARFAIKLASVDLSSLQPGTEQSRSLAKALNAAQMRQVQAMLGDKMNTEEGFNKWAGSVSRRLSMYGSDTTTDSDGVNILNDLSAGGIARLRDLAKNSSAPAETRQVQDIDALRALLDREVPREKFDAWLQERLAPAMGERRIVKDSGKTAAYTMENIVKEMTRKVQDAEGFNYGLGNARSKGATKFKSIKQIQGRRGQIVPKAEFEAARKEIEAEFSALTDAVESYKTYERDMTSELLAEAIGNSYKMGVGPALEAAALVKVPADLQQRIAEFASALTSAPTEYFEAKPQRAVGFNEFRGAVVPDTLDPAARQVLEDAGLTLAEYAGGDEAARAAAVNEMSAQMHSASGDVLFQKARGTFNPQTFVMTLNENADLSTFLHESGHFFLEVMADLASQPDAPAQVREDMDKLLAWFGIKGDENVGGQDADTSSTAAQPNAFDKWFGKSKIVDAEGKPLVMYHGTVNNDITEFRPGTAGAIFFTSDANFANDYTLRGMGETESGQEQSMVDEGFAPTMMPVFVKAENPFDLHDAEHRALVVDKAFELIETYGNGEDQALVIGGDRTMYTREALDYSFKQRDLSNWDLIESDELQGVIRALGFDSFFVMENGVKNVAVYSPTQVKSAIGNQGTFDPANPNILAQNGNLPTDDSQPVRRTPLETWRAMTLDQKRQYHERFAESFEQYLLEGKAPSAELQPLFRRFRSWLVNVYKSLQQFMQGRDLRISDDIRQVFDRLVATDEQIAAAEEAAGMLPDFDATNEAIERLQSRSLRDLKWTINARNKAIKALQKQATSLRKGVQEEVTAEVEQMPVYAARNFLRNDNKLSIAGLEEIYMGEGDRYALLDWKPLTEQRLAGKEGIHPDIAADMFGFESGDALVRAILDAEPIGSVIEGMTDQRMLERHGDLVDQRAIEQAANEAVHNEARARSLATELKAQTELAGQREDTGRVASNGRPITVNAIAKAAKDFAANLAARRKVKDLKNAAWQHRAAEARAGKAWQAATAAGKTQEAVQAKRDQVLNNAAAKALQEAQAEVKKIEDFARRVLKGNDEKVVERGRDPDVVNAMRAILGAYGWQTAATKRAEEYMDVVSRNDPVMYAALQPSVTGAMVNAKPWDTLSMEELRGLHDELRAMWNLAKASRQMEVDGNMLDIDDAEAMLQDRMQEIGVPDTIPGERGAITTREEVGIKLQFAKAILSRVEQWAERIDGKFGGPFLRLVFQPIKDAADSYRTDRVKYRQRFTQLLKDVAPAMGKGPIAAPELGYTFGNARDSGTAELLHAILHTGNDSNKRKLLLGRGWATENADGTLDTAKWDAFMQRLVGEGKLRKEHFDFAQGVWDLLEETKPQAQAAHRRVFGRYFAEITANEFIDPFGTVRRGGYVPAQTDARIVTEAKLRELAEAENESMAYAFPSAPNGFTKARVDYNKPLLLDLRTLAQHMDKVLLFSHMQPAVNDVRRLLTRKGVSYSLDRIDPGAYEGMLTPWLQRSARQVVETPIVGDRKLSRFLSAARSRAGMALMFANLSNTVQQITGFSSAAIKVKPSLMVKAAAKFTASPKALKRQVADASPFMKDRMLNEVSAMNDAIEQILIDPTLLERGQAWTQKHAYFMQTAVDNTMSPIIWTAAYNQAIEQGQTAKDAVRFADGVVRQTQGTTLPEDVSRFETGPAYARLFTQFIGYFNMMANTNATAVKQIVDEMGLRKGAGKLVYVGLAGLMVPIWVAELIANAFRGGPEDEDDDGYMDDWLMAVFGIGTVRGLAAQIPFVGQGAQLVVNRFNDNPADDKFSLSPAVSLIESAASAPASVYKAIVDEGSAQKAVRDVATAATLLTGLPIYAASRPLGYLAGSVDGKITPTSPADAARGLVTGTASPDSKTP